MRRKLSGVTLRPTLNRTSAAGTPCCHSKSRRIFPWSAWFSPSIPGRKTFGVRFPFKTASSFPPQGKSAASTCSATGKSGCRANLSRSVRELSGKSCRLQRKDAEVRHPQWRRPAIKNHRARLQQFERRIYFEADSAPLWLYYGDERLGTPEYDYAKLFQKDAHVEPVALNNEEANSTYTGRPDERPWSERHPAVLWTTIIAAVLILGGIAVRSLKTAPTPS